MKRLIVCCDGTWNRPDQINQGVAAPTNVAKVALALSDEDDAGALQLLHYQAGIGTRRWERALGGGLGVGLSRNVRQCYAFLVENYHPGDEIYFFGFSRGAFTARSTAGLVRNAGILKSQHRARIDEAYALYRDPDKDTHPKGIKAELFRRAYSHTDVYIQLIGVWDTVGALGIPIDGFRPPGLSRLWGFHDTTLSRYVRNAFHAIAIDERRSPFRPTLWTVKDRLPEQTLEQVWFAGVHCDIGGGYRDPALSEVPLVWMVNRARSCGLAFKHNHFQRAADGGDSSERRTGVRLAPDPLGAIHDSRTRFYRAFPTYDRCCSGEDGAEVAGGSVASSAKERYEQDSRYRPPGLEGWLTAERDIASIPAVVSKDRD